MTRLWSETVMIAVEADGEGQPLGFWWDHDSFQDRPFQVTQVANRWRAHTHWWREEIWREYFKVLIGSELLCTLYHDLLTDHWYLERVYD